ncbi:MAG: hypothetical protein ACREPM_04555 [Gemmatimonadaceae bacterium]
MWSFPTRGGLRCIAALGILAPVVLSAQQVTLPTARTVGPTPATKQLLAYFQGLDNWYKPANASDSAAQALLDYVRFRAILSPFEAEGLDSIAVDPRMERVLSELYKRDGAIIPAGFFPAPSNLREQVRNNVLLLTALWPLDSDNGRALPVVLMRSVADGLAFVEASVADSQLVRAHANLQIAVQSLLDARASSAGSSGRADKIGEARWRVAEAITALGNAATSARAASHDAAATPQGSGALAQAAEMLDSMLVRSQRASDSIKLGSATDQQLDFSTRSVTEADGSVQSARAHLEPPASADPALTRNRANLRVFVQADVSRSKRDAQILRPVVVTGRQGRANKSAPRTADSTKTPVDEMEIIGLTSALELDVTDPKLIGKLDTLGRLAQLVVIERRIDNTHWFPVTGTEEARVFWRQEGASPLNLGYAGISSTSASAMTEIAAPLLHFIRLSFNTTVAAHGDTSAATSTASTAAAPAPNTTALTQFLTGGGQFNLSGAVPILSLQHRQAAASGLLLFTPRVGGTLASVGTVHEDPSAFADIGMDLQITWADAAEHVGFVGQARYGAPCLSQTQAATLGLPKKFGYATWAAGLLFNEKFLLTVGRAAAGPAVLNRVKAQIGVTVIGAAK